MVIAQEHWFISVSNRNTGLFLCPIETQAYFCVRYKLFLFSIEQKLYFQQYLEVAFWVEIKVFPKKGSVHEERQPYGPEE